MKEERMAILKMVEDGKVSAEDATKLLEAISKTMEGGSSKKFTETGAEWQNNLEDKVKQVSKTLEEMGKDLGKRLESAGKDIEPKVRKVAQTIISKTTECVDEIAEQFKKDKDCCEGESCECEGQSEENEGSCCCNSENNEENNNN